MHRQNRAIGGAGVGIGEGEGSAGGKSWAWKMFSWIVLSIFVYIFFLLLSGDFADHSKFHARKSVKALYLMSQTMTGVGYGDMVPKTERSKVFFLSVGFGATQEVFFLFLSVRVSSDDLGR
ncbi:hypothetical protein ACFX1R_047401 [Malus domestica]